MNQIKSDEVRKLRARIYELLWKHDVSAECIMKQVDKLETQIIDDLLSALLTKIEERISEHEKTKGDSAYMDHDYVVSHAKIQEAKAVTSLIKQELER